MENASRKTPFVLIVLFLIFLLLGINLGEVAVVLDKATRICLSCMGLG